LLPPSIIVMAEDMSKKSPKIANLIKDCNGLHDPHYTGFFKCFNQQLYYEAHDVLEELWLQQKNHPAYHYYKGLIQAAGGFVHLKLHFTHPTHHVHGKRLEPAAKLFALARKNLLPYSPVYMDLPIAPLIRLLDEYEDKVRAGNFLLNPYHPDSAPEIIFPLKPI